VLDVERDGGRLLEGRPDVGRAEGRDDPPLEGGRRESMSLLHSEWKNLFKFNYM
jgi:hypothetical protein